MNLPFCHPFFKQRGFLLSAFTFLLFFFSSIVLAAGETPHFFVELTALFVASALIAYVCFRFGLTPIIGFLIAGVIIGPNALGFVQDRELIDAAAEVGVILLLFTIGIEFSLETLAKISRLIFIGGGLQVGLTIGLTSIILLIVGLPWQFQTTVWLLQLVVLDYDRIDLDLSRYSPFWTTASFYLLVLFFMAISLETYWDTRLPWPGTV